MTNTTALTSLLGGKLNAKLHMKKTEYIILRLIKKQILSMHS